MMFGCGSKDCREEIRKAETINIIKDLLEQEEMNFVSDFPSKEELPICINLKKVIVRTNCFEKVKNTDVITTVKLPVRTFLSEGEVCIEQLYSSKPIKDGFFMLKDSSDIVNQKNCNQSVIIPRDIVKNFKTVVYSDKTPIAKRYVQFSFPIFSKDNKRAYVEFDHHSTLERYGNGLLLEKINGKWKIVEILRGWNAC